MIDASLSGAVPKSVGGSRRGAPYPRPCKAEFEAAREPLVSAFAADAGAALRGCQGRVDELIDRVRRTAAEIFDVPLGPDAKHEAFELGEDPYWVTESTRATLIPDPSRLIDRLLPAGLRRLRLRARMVRQAEELIVRNAENLRWAILRGLDETFRKATAQFEERLDETIRSDPRRNPGCSCAAAETNPSPSGRSSIGLRRATASLASLREELQGGLTPAGCKAAREL